jgi:hypothetical protein
MAKVTLGAVYDQARSILGDDQISGGEVYTNAVLAPHIANAYRTLYRVLANNGSQFVEQSVTFTPFLAGTTSLDPATAGITDMGEPLWVGIRRADGTLQEFSECIRVDRLPDVGTKDQRLYAWIGDMIRFYAFTENKDVRVEYTASGSAPTNVNTQLPDDWQDFLATFGASMAAKSRGAMAKAAEFKVDALGPRGEADGSGGILRQMILAHVRNMQRMPPEARRRRAFRDSSPNFPVI